MDDEELSEKFFEEFSDLLDGLETFEPNIDLLHGALSFVSRDFVDRGPAALSYQDLIFEFSLLKIDHFEELVLDELLVIGLN